MDDIFITLEQVLDLPEKGNYIAELLRPLVYTHTSTYSYSYSYTTCYCQQKSMEADPDSDIYVPDGVQDEASSPEDQPEEDKLHSDGAPASVTQMIQETVAECPGAFLKFRITNPAIIAKDNKKKAAAEKHRQTAAEKRASKPKSSTKRKKVQTADSEEDEERETKKTKEDTEPEDFLSTAYIYVERPIPPAPA
ncbi:hypothetical protein B0H34DRAFT_795483 [Crassisporium funariophilum]|nr:hypothetical protein B0H34DRAFT_795483 [Crassisporium funariophilum]